MADYSMKTPLTDADVEKLKIGDSVRLSGVIYTARDAAHKRMIEGLDKGQPLPFDIKGSLVYYVGPSPTKPGSIIGSAGPSYRRATGFTAICPPSCSMPQRLTVAVIWTHFGASCYHYPHQQWLH